MTHAFVFATRPLVREALTLILANDPLIEVCGSAAEVNALESALAEGGIDTLVIDITHRHEIPTGLTAVAIAAVADPEIRTVLLADTVSDELILAAARIGAHALVDRSRPVAQLTDVTRNGHNGHNGTNHLSTFEVRAAQRRLRDSGVLSAMELGETDRQILELLKEGCTDKEISERIYLSPHTVRNRISRLLTILGKANRTQLAVMASNHDLHLTASR